MSKPEQDLPVGPFISPAKLAAQMGCSERALRKLARDMGVCRIIGKSMFFTQADVSSLLEAMKPAARKTAAHVQDGDYARLVALLEVKRRGRSGSKRP